MSIETYYLIRVFQACLFVWMIKLTKEIWDIRQEIKKERESILKRIQEDRKRRYGH